MFPRFPLGLVCLWEYLAPQLFSPCWIWSIFPKSHPESFAGEGHGKEVHGKAEVLDVLSVKSWVNISSWPVWHLFWVNVYLLSDPRVQFLFSPEDERERRRWTKIIFSIKWSCLSIRRLSWKRRELSVVRNICLCWKPNVMLKDSTLVFHRSVTRYVCIY